MREPQHQAIARQLPLLFRIHVLGPILEQVEDRVVPLESLADLPQSDGRTVEVVLEHRHFLESPRQLHGPVPSHHFFWQDVVERPVLQRSLGGQ